MFVIVSIRGKHEKLYVECLAETTLGEIKQKIMGQKNVAPKAQKLRAGGVELNDFCTLETYGIAAPHEGGTAEQMIELEILITGPIPMEETQLLHDLWEQTGGAAGKWKRDFGWADRLLKPKDCRGVSVEDQHIAKLNMPDNRLQLTVPATVANCIRLVELNLGYNLLSGAVPAAIGQCSGLLRLNLQWNKFTGELPGALFDKLQQLEYLFIDHNQLSGPIPSELGLNCKALRRLSLANNKLEQRVPYSVGLLQELEVLWLMHNPRLVVPYDVKLYAPAAEICRFYREDRVAKGKGWHDR